MNKTVGVVGLGIMGSAMAHHLLRAGFRVVGYDISKQAAEAFIAAGGDAVGAPCDVADRAPVVILSLPSPEALANVVDGSTGLLQSKSSNLIVIETSTLSIDAKQRALDLLSPRGVHLLDCPLSGTGSQARNKDLVVFASGNETAFRSCNLIFDAMSRRQVYLGAFGNGTIMKLLANHLVTIHNVAAGEAMALGQKAGLDPQLIYDALTDSAGSSRMFQVRGPLMVSGRYDDATAKVTTILKDINIISEFARGLDTPMPLFAAASQYYFAAVGQGRGDQDCAAVCAVSETFAGIRRN